MTSSVFIGLAVSFLLLVFIAFFLSNRYLLNSFRQIAKDAVPEFPQFPEPAPPLDLSVFTSLLKDLQTKQSVGHASHTKVLKDLAKAVKDTPSKTLSTIQGSVNNTVGKMGEMMQLIELQRTYDRLIVAGDIVDFIGVKFPTEGTPGSIDFIDIKTGKNASLNADQRKLRDLITSDEGEVTFKVVKVQIT